MIEDLAQRHADATEKIARDTDTLVLIAQLWSFVAVIGGVVWLILAVKGA